MKHIECPGCGAAAILGGASAIAANDDERLIDWEAPEGFRKVHFGAGFDRLYLYCVTCGVPAHVARAGLEHDAVSTHQGEGIS